MEFIPKIPQFIVFEGLDGCGKSTQATLLAKLLREQGLKVLQTHAPSQNPIGTLIRQLIHSGQLYNDEVMAILFAADLVHHYTTEIAPFLERGGYVICDRYYYSNLGYQGTNPQALKRILEYNQAVFTPPQKKPDIVFFLDVPPETCMERVLARSEDTSIYENLARQKQVRKNYQAAFELLENTENIKHIDCATTSEQETLEIIRQILYTHID